MTQSTFTAIRHNFDRVFQQDLMHNGLWLCNAKPLSYSIIFQSPTYTLWVQHQGSLTTDLTRVSRTHLQCAVSRSRCHSFPTPVPIQYHHPAPPVQVVAVYLPDQYNGATLPQP